MKSQELPYFLPLAKGVSVIQHKENGLVALQKPGGVLSTPNGPADLNKTILRAKFSKKDEAYVWFDKEQTKRYFYICHRLDSPTSGILIGTLGSSLAKSIRALFKTRKIQKTYIAVVSGVPRQQSGQWKDQLKSESKKEGHFVRSQVGGKGQEALTSWKVVAQDPQRRISLLELKPHTGRTHQLRVHSANHRLPIIGDRTYGDFKLNAFAKQKWKLNRLMLHAHRVSIEDKESHLKLQIESPLPPEFVHLFDN